MAWISVGTDFFHFLFSTGWNKKTDRESAKKPTHLNLKSIYKRSNKAHRIPFAMAIIARPLFNGILYGFEKKKNNNNIIMETNFLWFSSERREYIRILESMNLRDAPSDAWCMFFFSFVASFPTYWQHVFCHLNGMRIYQVCYKVCSISYTKISSKLARYE